MSKHRQWLPSGQLLPLVSLQIWQNLQWVSKLPSLKENEVQKVLLYQGKPRLTWNSWSPCLRLPTTLFASIMFHSIGGNRSRGKVRQFSDNSGSRYSVWKCWAWPWGIGRLFQEFFSLLGRIVFQGCVALLREREQHLKGERASVWTNHPRRNRYLSSPGSKASWSADTVCLVTNLPSEKDVVAISQVKEARHRQRTQLLAE